MEHQARFRRGWGTVGMVLAVLESVACASAEPRPRPTASPRLVLGGAANPVPWTVQDPKPDADDNDPEPVVRHLIERHNQMRAEAEEELPPLKHAPKLSAAAREQVQGMIEMGKSSHEGVDGSTAAERIKRQGYSYMKVGENVAFGQETVEEVVEGWMDSPGHRRNILGDFQEMGAARGEDEDGQPYWCVKFAIPLPQLDPDEAETALAEAINARRAEEDLDPLERAPALSEVARDHARAMAQAGSLRPEGQDPIEQLQERRLPFQRVALGIVAGSPQPEDVLETLQPSDVLGDFQNLGVGYATDEEGTPYWCLIFAAR